MAQEPNDVNAPEGGDEAVKKSFDDRLAAARKAEDERLAREHAPMPTAGSSMTWSAVSTMLGYPLGGIIVGFALDNLLDTTPWLTIILMFTAFAGACLHVARGMKQPKD